LIRYVYSIFVSKHINNNIASIKQSDMASSDNKNDNTIYIKKIEKFVNKTFNEIKYMLDDLKGKQSDASAKELEDDAYGISQLGLDIHDYIENLHCGKPINVPKYMRELLDKKIN